MEIKPIATADGTCPFPSIVRILVNLQGIIANNRRNLWRKIQ